MKLLRFLLHNTVNIACGLGVFVNSGFPAFSMTPAGSTNRNPFYEDERPTAEFSFAREGCWATFGHLQSGAVEQSGGRAPVPAGIFIENKGQWDQSVAFVYRRRDVIAWLDKKGILLKLRKRGEEEVVRITFEGASDGVTYEPENQQRAKFSFLLGRNPPQWHRAIPAFAAVMYRGLYPGVDVRMWDASDRLEYDLILSPGADLRQITMSCEGIDDMSVRSNGSLIISTKSGEIVQRAPKAWYVWSDGEREDVKCRYRLLPGKRFGFEVDGGGPPVALVIDPGLEWSTYLGGAGDETPGFTSPIFVLPSGETYVCGSTNSSDFPVTAAAFDTSYNPPGQDGFVSKFDPDSTGNSQLVWSTFLGGAADDYCRGISVDAIGAVAVTGRTLSSDFPVTPGAFDTSYSGNMDVFTAWLGPDGDTLLWSTFLGGTGLDSPNEVMTDDLARIIVTGRTESADFPVTPDAYDDSHNGNMDAFIARLDLAMEGEAQLQWSTFFGGSDWDNGYHMIQDSSGTITLGGYTESPDLPITYGSLDTTLDGLSDNFVARLDPSLPGQEALVWSTLLGGTDNTASEAPNGMAAGLGGTIVMAGWTDAADFPVTPQAFDTSYNGGQYDIYLSCLNGSGTALVYSTFLGGSGFEGANGLVVDQSGSAIVSGNGNSFDFPVTPGAYDTDFNGVQDGLIAKFSPDGSNLEYGTYLGASGDDYIYGLARENDNSVTVFGGTNSKEFPTSAGAYSTQFSGGGADLFVARLGFLVTDVTEIPPLPKLFGLAQNYPNPFNPSTTIEYTLPRAGYIRLDIINILGQRVSTVTEGLQDAGAHRVVFDAQELPTGVYFYRLHAGEYVETKKLLLLR